MIRDGFSIEMSKDYVECAAPRKGEEEEELTRRDRRRDRTEKDQNKVSLCRRNQG